MSTIDAASGRRLLVPDRLANSCEHVADSGSSDSGHKIRAAEEAASGGGASGSADELPGVSIRDLVARLHAGAVRVSDLSADDRLACVEYLISEGFTTQEAAELMRVSVRTAQRDRAAVRRNRALHPDRSLGDELLGEFQSIVHASTQRLTRLARDTSAPAYARLWAESAIVRNFQRFIETIHKLNYLEDGRRRIDRLREADPAEQRYAMERHRRQVRAMYEESDIIAQVTDEAMRKSLAESLRGRVVNHRGTETQRLKR